jgi:hypothetical protein
MMKTDKELVDFIEKYGIHWTGKAAYINGRIYGTSNLREAIDSAIQIEASALTPPVEPLIATGYCQESPSDVMVNINHPSIPDINSLIDFRAFPDKT